MNPTQVALYARVSSEQQAETQTIASRVAALRERVATDGLTVSAAMQCLGIGIGIGAYWGSYAYPYGYPPVVTVPSTQVYVPPSAPAPAQPPPLASWYYCDNPGGYYPYVQQCPGGWRPVAPTPP